MRTIRYTRLSQVLALLLALVAVAVLQACGEGPESASQALVREMPNSQGRILTANQDANTISVIDVATDRAYTSLETGKEPHHLLATPAGNEIWVTLYGENRLQVFGSDTLEEIASLDVGSSNDDLIFNPRGDLLYVSLGKRDEVAVIDVAGRKVIQTVKVGRTPHGLRVTPDGNYLLVANTLDNSVSLLSLQGEVTLEATIKTGANPFEVVVSDDSATAYISNFLGDSISVLDLGTRKTVGYIRSGKKPAMLALQSGAEGEKIWVANTGTNDLWVIDARTRKLTTRLPVGKGAHGALPTPSGKLYVTNTEDNTVTVVDQSGTKVLATIPVGNYPNGLTYLPGPDN